MININNKYYAKNNAEFVSQLFDKSLPRFEGTYKVLKGGIKLFNEKGELFAFIVNNKYKENFFVSASIQNGKPWYSSGLNLVDEAKLGFCEDSGNGTYTRLVSYSDEKAMAESVCKQVYGE